MSEPIRRIVIIGGGTAGWMAAATLARYSETTLPLAVTLIESSDIGTIGVGEATIPSIVDFNRQLGIDELDFIRSTNATFKLGIRFENWYQQQHTFFHPFSAFGIEVDQVGFHHYLHRMSALGSTTNFEDYSFACELAKQGRFAQPHTSPKTPLADYSYAYHFDASLYASYLKNYAVARQVTHLDAVVEHVQQHPDTGFITGVILQNGTQVEGDLFIDCTGFRGLLIEQTLQTGYESWQHWLLCDSALAVQTERAGNITPYTRSIAMDAGWQWRIPLQHRCGNGHIFSSHFTSDAKAKEQLMQSLTGQPLNEARKINFTPGRRKQIWHKNCFALGLASGFLEPLESTSISLIQTALAKLLSFFPDRSFNQADIAEVNRLHNTELERMRDFLILHYKLSQRNDSDFWRHCQAMAIPDSLAHKIELYKSRGHVVMYDEESFQEASWLAMYNGFKVKPARYDERANKISQHVLQQKLQQIRQAIVQAAQSPMKHDDFIQAHCQATS